MLADFCFSDLLLFVPLRDDHDETQPVTEDSRFIVVGHVRPSTTQTLYRHDLIGEEVAGEERPLVARSMMREEIIEGDIILPAVRERVTGPVHPGALRGPHHRRAVEGVDADGRSVAG